MSMTVGNAGYFNSIGVSSAELISPEEAQLAIKPLSGLLKWETTWDPERRADCLTETEKGEAFPVLLRDTDDCEGVRVVKRFWDKTEEAIFK